MENRIRPLSPWQLAVAAGVEGICFLTALLLHLVESVGVLIALQTGVAVTYALSVGATLVSCAVVAPLRLGRWLWYLRWQEHPAQPPPLSRLWTGYRHWFTAARWQWAIWRRQTTLLLITAAPGLLVWGYGDRLTRQGNGVNSLLFFVLGGFLLLAAGAVILLRRCRYALIPLLIDRGCSAPLAVQVSIRLTRRRTGEWLNFWGSRVGQLLLCLVPGVSLWVRPRLHREYVLLLTGWLRPIPLDTTQRIPT